MISRHPSLALCLNPCFDVLLLALQHDPPYTSYTAAPAYWQPQVRAQKPSSSACVNTARPHLQVAHAMYFGLPASSMKVWPRDSPDDSPITAVFCTLQYIAQPAVLQLPYAPPIPPEAQVMTWGVPVAGMPAMPPQSAPPPPPAALVPPPAYQLPEPTKPGKGDEERYQLI
jgi:hypothetical protein